MHVAKILALIALCNTGVKATDLSSHDPLRLLSVTPRVASVPAFGRFELTLDLVATYDNPFDPADIDVYAEFVSPKGNTSHVNGFLNQAYRRKLENNVESIKPTGCTFWQVC
jgi:hypothetical protein